MSDQQSRSPPRPLPYQQAEWQGPPPQPSDQHQYAHYRCPVSGIKIWVNHGCQTTTVEIPFQPPPLLEPSQPRPAPPAAAAAAAPAVAPPGWAAGAASPAPGGSAAAAVAAAPAVAPPGWAAGATSPAPGGSGAAAAPTTRGTRATPAAPAAAPAEPQNPWKDHFPLHPPAAASRSRTASPPVRPPLQLADPHLNQPLPLRATQPPPPPLGPPPSYTPYDGDAIEGFVEALRQSI